MQPEDLSPAADRAIADQGTADAGSADEGAADTGAASAEPTRDTSAGVALAETAASQQAPISRVIDVPLTVTLRFGQRQLTLRELLELNTGSLLELDQQVEEPVHLMLGERVIARGEVVIVDGNYGMRVLEVVEHPATQRLATLSQA